MDNNNKYKHLGIKIEQNIYQGYCENHISKSDLVEIIILIFKLLNIMTISEYRKFVGKTYSGVKRYSKHLIKVNQFTFVADNE